MLLATLLLAHGPVHAQSMREANSAKQEREAIRKQLEAVKRATIETSSEKKQVSKALVAVEKRLDQTTQRISKLDLDRKALEDDIVDLSRQEAQLALDLANTQTRLAAVLRNQYRRTEINPTQAWLAGQSASQATREGYWYERVSAAEKALGEQQARQADELERLRLGLERKQDRLTDTIEQQNQAKRELAAQKEERSQLLADLNSKLKDQEIERKRLTRDESRLTGVINQITKAIEEAKKKQALELQKGSKPPSTTETRKGVREPMASPPPMPSTGDFAKLKGRLVLPVQGTVVGQFGKTRSKDGQGPVWRGLFISTGEGEAVRAVGKGRVVFGGWLRGFGEMIIVDHGDEFLTVYGNNGKLLKKTGDNVNAGDTIAETGNSSGNLDTGLYFELRRQGQALDPLSWTKGQ